MECLAPLASRLKVNGLVSSFIVTVRPGSVIVLSAKVRAGGWLVRQATRTMAMMGRVMVDLTMNWRGLK